MNAFKKREKVVKTNFYIPKQHAVSSDLDQFIRQEPAELPEISELNVVRHFTNLSRKNFSVDTNFYPLGSCTMKYNPKIADNAAMMKEFANVHPCLSNKEMQGSLEIMYKTGKMLSELTGMDGFSLQPAAGAHGEFTGIAMIKKHFEETGQEKNTVLVPDSAHGTNPSSAMLNGYKVKSVATGKDGLVDIEDLKAKLDSTVAAFMLTNPNTLGLFETQILEIASSVHKAGAMLYYDGANLNAIAGIIRPGDMGFDVVHLNLHKTFATPHGGGGPGAGPVLCKNILKPYLPVPLIEYEKKSDTYNTQWGENSKTIGMTRSFFGQFPVILRAYVYLIALGSEGIRNASYRAVLNANYLMKKLEEFYEPVPGGVRCMHEFVISAKKFCDKNVRAFDIAKALIDYGIHPPTIYFPLVVSEAMMIEPTETESMETLDNFVDVMKKIYNKIQDSPEEFQEYPLTTGVSRVDEVKAVKEPNLRA
ncbi:MAG: aminomethyl-transferring glycine dehydrogenase subunit GcvPB [Spirochaetes bacterium]|nr:aminomethyl-transferring glycine dehydrogenase subunit GcvPB [Spirochaetota bacterium]